MGRIYCPGPAQLGPRRVGQTANPTSAAEFLNDSRSSVDFVLSNVGALLSVYVVESLPECGRDGNLLDGVAVD